MALHTDTGFRAEVAMHGTEKPRVLTNYIISANTSKNMYGMAGYALDIFPHTDVMKLRQNDWVSLYGREGEDEELLMWGPIDSVIRVRTGVSSGAVEERIRITGTDFSKAMHHTEVIFDPVFGQDILKPQFFTDLARAATVGGPLKAGKVVQAYINMFQLAVLKGQHQEFLLPDGRSLYEPGVLDFESFISDDTDGVIMVNDNIPVGGNLWDLIHQYSDPSRNFLFTDVVQRAFGTPINGGWAPVLRLGRLPFLKSDFEKLDTTNILTSRDVRSESVGFSDMDIKNWVAVRPQIFANSGIVDVMHLASGVRYDADSGKRNGIRRHEPQTMYVLAAKGLVTGENTDDIVTEVDKEADRQAEWFMPNEYLASGTYNLRFMPKIKVCTRLIVKDDYTGETFQYLVESVSHNWSFAAAQSSTSVQVTRGTNFDTEVSRSLQKLRIQTLRANDLVKGQT
jgi:hypothetical protein